MKNTIKLLGIAALVAVIGFSMAACGGDDPGDDNGPTFLGATPTLSGQVYVAEYNEATGTGSFKPYNGGNLTVSAAAANWEDSGGGGSSFGGPTEKGTIKNGQFNITLGKPTGLDNLKYILGFSRLTVSINPSTAKGYDLVLITEVSNNEFALSKLNYTESGTSSTLEYVNYVYVDKDCTISSNGGTETYESRTETISPFNLSLQAGWNTVYEKQQNSLSGGTRNSTTTYSMGNPNLKWVLVGIESSEPPEAIGGGGGMDSGYEKL